MDVLDQSTVDVELAARGLAWQRDGHALVKTRSGRDFADSLDYVNRVGALAAEADHHPDVTISWDTVTLRLWTHTAGGITERDLELAARVDGLDRRPSR